MTMAEVHEIVEMAIQVNGFGARDQEFTGDLPTVFIIMHGHVACLEISIHEHGWNFGLLADKTFNFYTTEPLNKMAFTDYKRYMEELLKRCPQPEVPNE